MVVAENFIQWEQLQGIFLDHTKDMALYLENALWLTNSAQGSVKSHNAELSAPSRIAPPPIFSPAGARYGLQSCC